MVLAKEQLAFVGSAAHLAAQADKFTHRVEVPVGEPDAHPSNAQPVKPTLEDGYLAVLGKEAYHAK